MKYGIKYTTQNGEQYVSSSRFSPAFSDDLSDIALFNSEAKAIAGGRKILLNGFCTDGRLEVIEVRFNIVREIKVPESKPKRGFTIHRPATSRFDQYLTLNNVWTNKERCKLYKTEQEADAKLAQLIDDCQRKVAQYASQGSHGYYMKTSTQKLLDQLNAAKVIQLS